ncbi:hypothetical protein M0R88_09835 [Halorussus gelatinilyticus]|uniref:Uncharacterized protein n=1 Tax=Halorussus gelatinilyticus TaxID=2937524 RepID=A0A8U0ID02_9EURY|nr:hypothetical protein [Halorussus gelatinilyticus]UPV98832.1 hypothetical protein M0R88_09835 [Halorussus gelatinilyticus]
MIDLDAIHEEIRYIREDTDADRDVRLSLDSIEEALAGMRSGENDARPDRIKEIRAEIDRLSDDAGGETADELDRLRERIREYEREQL